MNTKRYLFSLVFLVSVLIFTGCKHEPEFTFENNNPEIPTVSNECDPDTVYFQNDVLPLLISTCTTSGCHDKESAEDGVILTDYLSVIQTGEVRQYDPYNSEMFEKIIDTDLDKRMPPPPENPLSVGQQELIKKWIEQGAKNNSCSTGCDTLNVTFSKSIRPTIQTNCTGCHSGPNAGGRIILEDYPSIVAVADNGSLLGAVSHDVNYSPMPKNGGKLSDCKIAEIKIWIENGTPDN